MKKISRDEKQQLVVKWCKLQFDGKSAGEAADAVGRHKRCLESWRYSLFSDAAQRKLKSAGLKEARAAGKSFEEHFPALAKSSPGDGGKKRKAKPQLNAKANNSDKSGHENGGVRRLSVIALELEAAEGAVAVLRAEMKALLI